MADFEDDYLEDEAPVMDERDYTLIFCRRKRTIASAATTADTTTTDIPVDGAPVEVQEVLLGLKKRGYGAGKLVGFGGKVEENESFHDGAARELQEECFLKPLDLKKRGYIVFRMAEQCKFIKCHVYEAWNFEGVAAESDEMRPQWYAEADIPYDLMWKDDIHWLPLMLKKNTMIVARFNYSDSETIEDYSVKEM